MISIELHGAGDHFSFLLLVVLCLFILIGTPIFTYRMGKDQGRWDAEREQWIREDKEWEARNK